VRNYGGYSNPRADYVLKNGLKAAEIKARAVNYRTLLQILHDDRPTIFLYNETSIAGYSSSLSGIQMQGNGQLVVAYAQYEK
jgi:ABC-type transport system substrate-binding protein